MGFKWIQYWNIGPTRAPCGHTGQGKLNLLNFLHQYTAGLVFSLCLCFTSSLKIDESLSDLAVVVCGSKIRLCSFSPLQSDSNNRVLKLAICLSLTNESAISLSPRMHSLVMSDDCAHLKREISTLRRLVLYIRPKCVDGCTAAECSVSLGQWDRDNYEDGT